MGERIWEYIGNESNIFLVYTREDFSIIRSNEGYFNFSSSGNFLESGLNSQNQAKLIKIKDSLKFNENHFRSFELIHTAKDGNELYVHWLIKVSFEHSFSFIILGVPLNTNIIYNFNQKIINQVSIQREVIDNFNNFLSLNLHTFVSNLKSLIALFPSFNTDSERALVLNGVSNQLEILEKTMNTIQRISNLAKKNEDPLELNSVLERLILKYQNYILSEKLKFCVHISDEANSNFHLDYFKYLILNQLDSIILNTLDLGCLHIELFIDLIGGEIFYVELHFHLSDIIINDLEDHFNESPLIGCFDLDRLQAMTNLLNGEIAFHSKNWLNLKIQIHLPYEKNTNIALGQ